MLASWFASWSGLLVCCQAQRAEVLAALFPDPGFEFEGRETVCRCTGRLETAKLVDGLEHRTLDVRLVAGEP